MNPSIKFTIATDVHLGHKQTHPIRKQDSFNAFQQVLAIAQQQNVDFVLLGGDLFDQVNPSQKTIYKCLDLLQHYVQGQNPKTIHAHHLSHPQYKINFQNHNMNIKLPIFTIHGNHDYPSNDFGKLSICDLLHVSNYANYFGKHTDLKQIMVSPIIIQKKGVEMKVAVYGLGYIKDTVLNQMFENNKVRFQQLQNRQQYFCLFIFHQNRYKKGLRPGAPALKCINPKHIPQWMDLTIWGHQHEAINKIEVEGDRKIFQPGSTVITSFIQAQSYPKQCLKVQICNTGEVDLTPLPLHKSYRPMVCRNLQISQLQKKHNQHQPNKQFDFFHYLDQQLQQIISNTQEQYPGRKPIIRLKVQHSGYEISRWRILQLKYSQKVANPQNIMSFWKRRQQKNNQKQVFQAFVHKTNLQGYEHKQISQQILHIYTKNQQNRHMYYDPKQMYKHHINSVTKQIISTRDHLNHYMTKQIDKRRQPTDKQLKMIQRAIVRKVDEPAKRLLKQLGKVMDLQQVSLQKIKGEVVVIEEDSIMDINMKEMWEQQKRMVRLKEDEIAKAALMRNYGQNFFLEQYNQKEDHLKKVSYQKMQQQEDEVKRQTLTGKKQKPRQTFTSTAHSSAGTNNLSSWLQHSKPIKSQKTQSLKQHQQQKPTHNKPNPHIIQISSHDSSSQDDCCKRAQKTQYNQFNVKKNFDGANKMVRDNMAQVGKREVKKEAGKKESGKEVKKQQGKKYGKSFNKWSDDDYNEDGQW